MHKYSFMTSKCPFLHQDVKLTSQKLTSKSMMTILAINDDHNMVKLTTCSMLHIRIMKSVI